MNFSGTKDKPYMILDDSNTDFYDIADFDRIFMPEKFISHDGKNEKFFDRMREYEGARYVMSWEN